MPTTLKTIFFSSSIAESFKSLVEIVSFPEREPAGIVIVFLSTTNFVVSLTVDPVVLKVIDNVFPETILV